MRFIIKVFFIITFFLLCFIEISYSSDMGEDPYAIEYFQANNSFISAHLAEAELSGVNIPEFDLDNTYVMYLDYFGETERFFSFFEKNENDLWLYSNTFVLIHDIYANSYIIDQPSNHPEKSYRAEILFRCMVDHARLIYFDESFLNETFALPISLDRIDIGMEYVYT